MKYIYLGIILGLFLFSNIALATDTTPIFASDSSSNWVYLLKGVATMSDFNGQGSAVLERQLTYTTITSMTTTATRTAQSFNRSSAYNISGITVGLGLYYQYVPRDLNQGITLRIETDSGSDTPSGVLADPLLTKHLTPDEVIGGANSMTLSISYSGQATFMFNSSIPINASQKLWFVLIPDSMQTNWYYVQGYNTAGGYNDGTYRVSTTSGSTWGATVGDTLFFILGDGFNTSAYSRIGQTLTLDKAWALEVNGMSKLNLTAGDYITKDTLSANGGYLLRVGYAFGGGSVDMYGTPDNHVKLKLQDSGDTYYGTYPFSVYAGTSWGRWADIEGKTNGATLYNYGVYSRTDFANSEFKNTYNAVASYSYYQYRSARETTFNNCTFWRANTGAGYNIYLYATTYHDINFVNNNITTNGVYAYAVYNGEVDLSFPKFLGTTYNGVSFNKTHAQNGYAGGSYVIGNIVNPQIVDLGGNPIENAFVSVTPQFTGDDMNSSYQYGLDPRQYGAQAIYVFSSPPTLHQTTNADGHPVNEWGSIMLWMWDAMYFTTTEKNWINYTGSNMSVRTTHEYEWKNDGTDYGYILTATADGYSGIQMVIPSNQSYTSTIQLNSTTGILPNETSFCDFSIDTTADFDIGTKSNSSNNYEVETWTDNLDIQYGWVELGNMYSDRFTYDNDFLVSNTSKWYNWNENYTYNVTFESYISNGTYTSALQGHDVGGYADQNLVFQSMLTGDFDVQVNYSDYDKGTCDGSYAGIVFGDTPDWTGSEAFGMYRMYDSGSGDNYYASSWIGGINTYGLTSDTNGTLRITRTNGVVDWFVWDFTNNGWNYFETSYETTDDMYVYLYNTETGEANVSIKFDDFRINSGALVEDPVRASGNWKSQTINMVSGNYLNHTSIDFFNPDPNSCIDKIQWLVGGNVKAETTTDICDYDTEIHNETQQADGQIDHEDGYWMVSPVNAYDNDWDSHAESTTTGYLYWNYHIPTGATINSLWHVKDGGFLGDTYLQIPSGCLDGLDLRLTVSSSRIRAGKYTYYGADWSCWDRDINDWNYLRSNQDMGLVASSYIYEQEVIWEVEESIVDIEEANLTSGSFSVVNNDFQIKMFMKGDTTTSPTIDRIYCEEPASPVEPNIILLFMGDSTYSVISSNNTYFGFKNEKETFLEYILRLLGKDLRTLIGIET